MNGNLKVATVRFGSSDRTYDYLIPDDVSVGVGEEAFVETRDGEAKVEVVALKDKSEMATKPLLRAAERKDEKNADAE